jgi:tetratricopeptide (TPR) repeat protein
MATTLLTGTDDCGAACPDAELLSSYVNGRATSLERTAIEEHIARCEDCYFVFAETLWESQGDSASQHGRRWAVWAAWGLAAAALLVVAQAPLAQIRYNSQVFGLKWVVSAADGSSVRAVNVRVGEIQRSATMTASVREHALSKETVATLIESMGAASQSASSNKRREAAIYLVAGDAGRAVATLAPLAATSEDATLQNDLAAAYMARSQAGDAAHAFEAASKAIDIEASRPEAWFNLGLAAESLGLSQRAKDAWIRYLTLDSSSARALQAVNAWVKTATAEEIRAVVDGRAHIHDPRLIAVIANLTEEPAVPERDVVARPVVEVGSDRRVSERTSAAVPKPPR